ncbi:MAG: S1 RNA-binding domain-containing protein [Streptococcaceae bacterium]|jgi:general stress protein 13|nr:S1 RNA-binding domain-containing protein [Streptococcaceae bacterium]
MQYKIGDIIEGQVSGIQPYGAFVSLDNQTQGLIHVSEIQAGYTKNIYHHLYVGQKIKAKIIDIDDYSKKISLSIRILDKKMIQQTLYRKNYFTSRNVNIGFKTIEEGLPIWIENALSDLSRK